MPSISSNSVRVFYPRWDKEKIIATIQARLAALKKELPLLRVVLFGSYVKQAYTVASDVDLLVVYQDGPRPEGPRPEGDPDVTSGEKKDPYATIKKLLNIPRLEPHVYAKSEYNQMEEIISKMIKGGIILFQSS